MRVSYCKSPDATAIVWARSPTGAFIPIDYKPSPVYWPALGDDPLPADAPGIAARATTAYELVDVGGDTEARPIGQFRLVTDPALVPEDQVRPLRVGHFVTCPYRHEHRKKA